MNNYEIQKRMENWQPLYQVVDLSKDPGKAIHIEPFTSRKEAEEFVKNLERKNKPKPKKPSEKEMLVDTVMKIERGEGTTADSLYAGQSTAFKSLLPDRYKQKDKKVDKVDIVSVRKDLKDVRNEIEDLEDGELDEKDRRILALLKEREKELYASVGMDTTGYSEPMDLSAKGESGLWETVKGWFEESPNELKDEKNWKSKHRTKIMRRIGAGEIDIPSDHKGTSYDFATKLVDEAWKMKMEKPIVDKKISEMTNEEIQEFLNAK